MGQLRKDMSELDRVGQAGDWCFEGDDLGMFIRYGASFEQTVHVYIHPEMEGHWQWDGNREAPTLSPSIRVHYQGEDGQDVELWHGFLRAGSLETA